MTRVAAQTIMRLATGAHARFANFDFQGRNQRSHKLELANRADILAEARASEQGINGEGRKEIVDNQPGC
jgi:predicted nucleotide-binding protein